MCKSNGWGVYYTDVLEKILDDLIAAVSRQKEKDPIGYLNNKKTKHLHNIFTAMVENVPQAPEDKIFLLGKSLGKNRKAWRRVKKGIQDRHRLFFRYSSDDKAIVYAWLNDEKTLRKENAKTDVYNVFRSMLQKGDIPDDWLHLFAAAREVTKGKTSPI